MSDQSHTHTVIPFPCPLCAAPLRVAIALAGRKTSCPTCHGQLVVPDRPPDPPATVIIRPEELEETVVLQRPSRPPTPPT